MVLCMLIANNDHNNTIQVYSVTVMTNVIALEARQYCYVICEPITPVYFLLHRLEVGDNIMQIYGKIDIFMCNGQGVSDLLTNNMDEV